jgi:hypothetical protein
MVLIFRPHVLLQRGLADELPGELPEVQLRLRLVRPRVAGHRGQPVLDELHLEQPGLVQGTSPRITSIGSFVDFLSTLSDMQYGSLWCLGITCRVRCVLGLLMYASVVGAEENLGS